MADVALPFNPHPQRVRVCDGRKKREKKREKRERREREEREKREEERMVEKGTEYLDKILGESSLSRCSTKLEKLKQLVCQKQKEKSDHRERERER